jgi:hypothetical protein
LNDDDEEEEEGDDALHSSTQAGSPTLLSPRSDVPQVIRLVEQLVGLRVVPPVDAATAAACHDGEVI